MADWLVGLRVGKWGTRTVVLRVERWADSWVVQWAWNSVE
jgi:hypothetical protein